MSSERTRVLVAGATGNQGGAVARELLDDDSGRFEVHALTRNAGSSEAKRLEAAGAKVVEGDLEDPATLEPLVEDVDAVFGVSNFWDVGYDRQVEQVTNLAKAAANAGVNHFVMSGVGSSEKDTGIAHFESCDEIESNIDDLGIPRTFVRPVFFMQNFEPMAEDILGGTIALPLTEGTSLQMVDATDVGRTVARVLSDRDAFVGEAMEVAGDEATLSEMAQAFSKVTGRTVEPVHVPIEDARAQMGDEWADMCDWFNRVGYSSDIGALERKLGFTFTKLTDYLQREGWDQEGKAPSAMPGWVKATQ